MNTCPEGFVEIVEGLAKICIPNPELYRRSNGVFEPAWAPVFYNPNMVENRDIAVEVVEYITRSTPSTKGVVIVDPLAATGVRSIRIALEVSKPEVIKVFAGDISENSINNMYINVKRNNLEDKIVIEKSDANELLYRLRREGVRISYIDVDPFGSPAPFSHAALSTIKRGGVVAFTATDLAVLEGKYVDKMFRRYGVAGGLSPLSKEIAIRVLLSYIARVAYIFDRFIEPMISYVYKHYVRVYVSVFEGATKASNQAKTCLGVLLICPHCGYNYKVLDAEEVVQRCPLCKSNIIRIEPLWICKTNDREVLEVLNNDAELKPWIRRTSKYLLKALHEYADVDSLSIRLSYLARFLRINTPPRNKVIECLTSLGFKSVKSYTYSDGIATTASIKDVLYCIKY